MHILYDPASEDWSEFLLLENVPVQYGSGAYGSHPYFEGYPYQRGAGLGSVLKSIYRFLLPIGQKVGEALGQEGIHTASRVLNNVVAGKGLKESVQQETRIGLRNLLDKASTSLEQQSGNGVRKRVVKRAHAPRMLTPNSRAVVEKPIKIPRLARRAEPLAKPARKRRVDALGFW